jgi:hypothetical protein
MAPAETFHCLGIRRSHPGYTYCGLEASQLRAVGRDPLHFLGSELENPRCRACIRVMARAGWGKVVRRAVRRVAQVVHHG